MSNLVSQLNLKWNGGGTRALVQKSAGMLEVYVVTALTTQIVAMQNRMNTHFSNLALWQQHALVNVVQQPYMWYEVCGSRYHATEDCGKNP